MDTVSKQKRSKMMAGIRSKDTQPEVKIRSIVRKMGFRPNLNRANLPGKPDIVIARARKVILIHGCFWHGHEQCSLASKPKTNSHYWTPKIQGNKDRDTRNLKQLKRDGWHILQLWECDIRAMRGIVPKLVKFLFVTDSPQPKHRRRRDRNAP